MSRWRMPAEWESHAATWIAWPHEQTDWPGKFETVRWVYAEIVRHLATSERVEILCHDQEIQEQAQSCLEITGVKPSGYRLHLVPNDRSWVRDSGPTAVRREKDRSIAWVHWNFNAWAKYSNYKRDEHVAEKIASLSGLRLQPALRHDTDKPVILEGGSIDADGAGTLLTTEECLLSSMQERNPGFGREDYERMFRDTLGIDRMIWLHRGIVGDDTHGHVDDIARFVAPGVVITAYEEDTSDPNFELLKENFDRLTREQDARGKKLEVLKLPMPSPVIFEGERLPASYCNFYIANRVVLVPTFNDPKDRLVLNTLQQVFPDRQVIGIHAVDLVLGLGTLHCLTQQQPQ